MHRTLGFGWSVCRSCVVCLMTRLIHTANGAKVSSPVDRHLMVPLVTGDPSRILSLVGHFSPGKYLRATNLSRTENFVLFCFSLNATKRRCWEESKVMRVDVCYTRDFRFFGCAGWVGCVLFCCRPTRFLWFGQVRHFFLGVIVVMMCVSLPPFFVSFFSFFSGWQL